MITRADLLGRGRIRIQSVDTVNNMRRSDDHPGGSARQRPDTNTVR